MTRPVRDLPLASASAAARGDGERSPRSGGALLKACIFATGFAGIVAEYVMATLASYLLGDAVLQWTLTISLMLFAMGVGSRLSRFVRHSVLDAFAAVELVLSLLCATSAVVVFFLAAWITNLTPVVYSFSIAIGLLIGLEIPLATRLNDVFEELRVNVSAVMEKDYYGALLGGLLFAFVALPHLGLTYTPIALGAVNLGVAALLFVRFRRAFSWRRSLSLGFAVVPALLLLVALVAEPLVLFGEQRRYRDRVVHHEQTPYQRIVLTRWKDDHWLYIDGHEQFSSVDEHRYHEPLVHPAMTLAPAKRQVLILGGGDGLALREVLQYEEVEGVTLVDLDPAMTRLASTHPVLVELNEGSLQDPRVRVVNEDAFEFLQRSREIWDVILLDLPDPKSADLARLYSLELYGLAARQLSPGGVLVTQATSPLFTRRAFLSILETVRAAGLVAVPYHNHVPTLGEWGWVLGVKRATRPAVEVATPEEGSTAGEEALKERLSSLRFDHVETRFLNRDAMIGMLHFGKGFDDDVEVSDHSNLAVFYYYRQGDWDLY